MLLLVFQAGCIPHYSDFVGAQDSRGTDAGTTDERSGDGGGEVAKPDIADMDQRVCIDDVCVCKPDCTGKQCGPDGCGGSCGDCSGCQSVCTDAGKCAAAPEADSECHDGDIYWKDTCGAWGEKATECGEAGCNPGSKVCADCEDLCSGVECGMQGKCDCGTCPTDKSCQSGVCEYHCGDGLCADAGGETCCTCPADCGLCCGNGACDCEETCATCVEDCGCADCGEECLAGECTFTACAGKECGDDGCGGSCGECSGGKECQAGNCVCTPQHHKGCSGGRLYWYDSCNAQGVEVSDCDDGNPCTTDGCSGSQCTHSNKGDDTPCGNDKSCQSGVCEYHCGDGLCAEAGGETCETCPADCEECLCEPGVSTGKKTTGQNGVVWVEIPAGCFLMGCSPGDGDCANAEKPPHEVMVAKFEMMETEVTEGQYSAVIGGDPSCDYNGGGGTNSPVECIDWDQAVAFCEAVDPKGRLCTEAEWEYAARGGTTTKYYCGNDAGCLDDIAWYNGNSDDGPGKHKHDVKGKDANAYGLYDMLGNVWEWVEDCWHSDYDLNDDGEGDWDVGYPAWITNCSGSYRVRRGGGFYYVVDDFLRVSFRSCGYPSYVLDFLGLRCCRSE